MLEGKKSSQNMTSSKSDHRHSNHRTTNRVLTCYICDRSVKDYRLSSHLFFGSLQCRSCDLKFRYCKDFDSFRRTKHPKKGKACKHKALKWTRDPVEYLERKLRKELAKSKSSDKQPSTKEVTKSMVSYMSKLKPIECKSPWKYVFEKVKKYTLLRHIHSKPQARDSRNGSHENHHCEKEPKKENGCHLRRNGDFGSSETKDCPHDSAATEKVSRTSISGENIEDDISMCVSYLQSEVASTIGEDMIPQCVEEIVIPQTEWEVDVISFHEFEECNKSVSISLGNGYAETPLIVEEVCSTKHEETGDVTLIIENINHSLEIEPDAEMFEDNMAHLSEVAVSGVEPVSEVSGSKLESAEIYTVNGEPESQFQGRVEEPREKLHENKEEPEEGLHQDSYAHDDKLKTLALVCADRRRTEMEQDFNQKSCVDKEEDASNENETSVGDPLSDVRTKDILNQDEDISEDNHLKTNLTECKMKDNILPPKEKLQKRKSFRLKNAVCQKIRQTLTREQDSLNPQRHCRNTRLNAVKTPKYNLRSRRNKVSNSFLQRLDAYEKKKLWEKLVPTARKLYKLRSTANGENIPSFSFPINSDENDDDFLVDVLLSQALDVQHLGKLNHLTNEEDNNETALLNQVKRAIKQFCLSINRPYLSAAVGTLKPFGSQCVKEDGRDLKECEPVVAESQRKKESKKKKDYMVFGKDTPKRPLKTFFVSPPADGNYYVIRYPSQPFITECPMCYFRVFPAMFSLNLVTNLATTKCVGCTLTIYVVQEPDDSNSFPKIVFRREEISEIEDPLKVAKPARYKEDSRTNPQRKVSARNFFKQ